MSPTTTLKLPDALKATIAKVAALEGKTSHALMVETLQTAMEDALARQQFYAEGEAAMADTRSTNRAYRPEDVKSYIQARIRGGNPERPQPVPFDPSKPMARA
jgi:predicted transcriptional regulator